MEQGDRQVAQGSECLGRTGHPDGGVILYEYHIADPMDAFLDAPVRLSEPEERRRGGLVRL